MVTKLQETILYGTRRVVLLVHCIVLTVPIFPQNPKTIWITSFLRSTVPQNLIPPSSVNFALKSFQDFRLSSNIEELNTECRSDQEQKMRMWKHTGRCWGSPVERRVAFLSTFLGGFGNWKSETQSIQLRSGNPQQNNRERETWSIYQ